MFGVFQNLFFSSPSVRNTEGIFPWCLLWDPGWALEDKSYNTVGMPICLGPLELLIPRFVCLVPLAVCQLQLRYCTPGTGCYGGSHCWVSAWVSCDAPYLNVCLSTLGGSDWPCVHSSLKDPRRAIDFSACSAFCLLGQNGDFQAPYMQNQKPEVKVNIFLLGTFFYDTQLMLLKSEEPNHAEILRL